jgi:polyhydroxyalkanoate synthesis repressor PhaR
MTPALIKRYANRKLYDMVEKRYVTLPDIAEMVRQGREIQVVDHTTGADLTALTLSQIILRQEKNHAGSFSCDFLTTLVQAGGDVLVSISAVIQSAGLPGRRDYQRLERQVADLEMQLEQFLAHAGGSSQD